MVGLNDSCPCCSHKRRRSVLDRLKSCPVSFTDDATLRPANVARSSSPPSHSCIPAVRAYSVPHAAAIPPSPFIPPTALRLATASPINSEVSPVPDKKEEGEEEKVETGSEKNDERRVKIRGAESVRITIKCKCGSVQEVQF